MKVAGPRRWRSPFDTAEIYSEMSASSAAHRPSSAPAHRDRPKCLPMPVRRFHWLPVFTEWMGIESIDTLPCRSAAPDDMSMAIDCQGPHVSNPAVDGRRLAQRIFAWPAPDRVLRHAAREGRFSRLQKLRRPQHGLLPVDRGTANRRATGFRAGPPLRIRSAQPPADRYRTPSQRLPGSSPAWRKNSSRPKSAALTTDVCSSASATSRSKRPAMGSSPVGRLSRGAD